jgi:hypothetical protein
MERILVHIGYHKTATTWLQQQLFFKGNDVFQPLSRLKDGPSSLAAQFTSDPEWHMLNSFEMNEKAIRDEINSIIKEDSGFSQGKIIVFSNERLSGIPHSAGYDSKIISERLKNIFPDAKILIVVREQKSFILSSYFQYLSQGASVSLYEYVYTRGPLIKPYFSPGHINYVPLITEYIKLFGEKNVLVLPYELFRESPQKFVAELGIFVDRKIEISPDKFKKRINTKENYFTNYHLRKLHRYLALTSNNRSIIVKCIRYLVGIFIKVVQFLVPEKMDHRLLKNLKKEIEIFCGQKYLMSNKELSKIINKDLSVYGY